MSSFNMTTAVELLKRLYPNGLEEMLYKKVPTYGVIGKMKDFRAEGEFLVWKYSTGGGASSVFANAQANKGAAAFKRPFITRTKEYALASLDGEFLEASQGKPNAVAGGFKVAMDDAIYNVSRSVGFQLFRNGGGARGRLAAASSGVGTTQITLTSTSSMQGFERGMWVQSASTDGTSGSVNTGKAMITAVDRLNKKLTTTAAWNTLIPAIADSDYLFRDGDFGNVIKGFEAWCPSTAPTGGDSFFGVDRSSDPDRLAGIRYDASAGGTIQEILVAASALALDYGVSPDMVILNPLDFANLVNQVGSKSEIPIPTDKPAIGFKGLSLYGASGTMSVMCDPCCPRYKAWMITQDTWELWSIGDVPKVLNRDGNETLRESNADADELRVAAYLQLVCMDPGANVNISLPTAG